MIRKSKEEWRPLKILWTNLPERQDFFLFSEMPELLGQKWQKHMKNGRNYLKSFKKTMLL
ncbi:hypothetical protein BOX24_06510 [Leptospirillum ferriphilum]|uniref:Uncharacterized protein n=1 Tax=Leptospirillum ferriphilum TaxID=178606 RepID=A0A1V3SWK3_9BACT|nr:hypothetical protein BOX24_06510 [Leptospirillum ferriphilum]